MAVGITKIPGLMDFRDARSYDEATDVYTHYPNGDYLYGPYASLDEAFAKLSEKTSAGSDSLLIGKTVGIITDGAIEEYWFKEACSSVSDLVLKNKVASGSEDDSEHDTEYDDGLKKMKVTFPNGDTYVSSAWVKVTKPAKPTITPTSQVLISGNATFTITAVSGASISYALYDSTKEKYGDYKSGSSIVITTGYDDTKDNKVIQQVVRTKCSLNGMTSDANEVTLTVTPQCAAPSITITRNGNNNIYSSQATVTLGLSPTKDATTQYKEGSGDWQTIINNKTITVSTSKDAEYFQVRATKYGYVENSVKSDAFTLNTPKMYYGGVTATPTDTKGLTALEANTLPQGVKFNGYVRAAFAYPASLGKLSHIYDSGKVTDYISNFTPTEMTVNGTKYYVYTLNNAALHTNFVYNFTK